MATFSVSDTATLSESVALSADFAPHGSNPNGYIASASTQFNGTLSAGAAFDGGVGGGQYWIGTNAGVDWLQLDLLNGKGATLDSYIIQVNTIPEPARAPKNFTMKGSLDGTNFTVLDTRTNQTSWTSGERRTFTLGATSAAYRYFRVDITANNGDTTFTQIAELFLFGTLTATPVTLSANDAIVLGDYATYTPLSLYGLPPVTTNLQFFFDARNLQVYDGETIPVLSDSSGNSNDARVTAGTATYHTNQNNGRGAITLSSCIARFAGSITGNIKHSCFVVFKLSSTSKGTVIGASQQGGFAYWMSTTQGIDAQNSFFIARGTDATDTTTWHQANVVHTGNIVSPSAVNNFRYDRTDDTTVNGSLPTANTGEPTGVGANINSSNEFFSGQIQAIAYYNTNLSSTDIALVEAYLTGLLVINVNDSATVTESIAVSESGIVAAVNDASTVTETISPLMIGRVNISDSTVLVESISVVTPNNNTAVLLIMT